MDIKVAVAFINENILALTIAGTLVGWLVLNRFTLSHEKRKEFNIAAEPIRLNLIAQLSTAQKNKYPLNDITDSQFEQLKSNIPIPKQFFYTKALNEYKNAQQESGDYINGRFDFHSPEILISSISRLIKYTTKK